MAETREKIRMFLNRMRIWALSVFTNRVRKFEVEDPVTGKKFGATVVKTEEKVCDHKRIREIAPTMWKCEGCDDVYFQIGYKVMLTRTDLIGYLEEIATHFKTSLDEVIDGEHDQAKD